MGIAIEMTETMAMRIVAVANIHPPCHRAMSESRDGKEIFVSYQGFASFVTVILPTTQSPPYRAISTPKSHLMQSLHGHFRRLIYERPNHWVL